MVRVTLEIRNGTYRSETMTDRSSCFPIGERAQRRPAGFFFFGTSTVKYRKRPERNNKLRSTNPLLARIRVIVRRFRRNEH